MTQILHPHPAPIDVSDVAAPAVANAPELTVIVPTFNERSNIPVLIERLNVALCDVAWEAIFVDDDSPDGTFTAVRTIGETDPRVRCIRRVGRRGLAGACIEGMLASQGKIIAVIDGDLQHDESLLPLMLEKLRNGEAQVIVGSRYVAGANADGFSRKRQMGSNLASALAKRFLRVAIADPLSGFFMMHRQIAEDVAPRLSGEGFKILLDVLMSAGAPLRVVEIPFTFRPRRGGTSKLDGRIVLDFIGLLLAKYTGDLIPVRFFGFLLVGASGVLVHLLVLKSALTLLGLSFSLAQALATLISMVSNFSLNNALTYRDQRLRGIAAIKGLAWFMLICSMGAVSNIGVASWVYANEPVWWFAGITGSLISAVWNYSLSSRLVWGRSRR
jgi:dolichol-phosphate mannosyltransferase